MGGGFPDDQGLDAHRRGIPQDEANIHGVGYRIDDREQPGTWQVQQLLQRGRAWDVPEAEDSLEPGS